MKIQELNAYSVLKCKNKILIMRRKNGLWEFPGGGVDFGEHPFTSALRECKEETGIDIGKYPAKYITITSAVYEKDKNEKQSIYVVYLFEVKCNDSKIPQVKMNPEHDKYEWADIKKLKRYKWALNAEPVIELI